MIYEKKNKVLQGETIIISELSGDLKIQIIADEIDDNIAYYLEILCPKNIKYCLQRCTVEDRILSVDIPNGILVSKGDIYGQIVCRDKVAGKILDKSLVTALPIITVTRSINASDTVNIKAAHDVIAEMIIAKDKMEDVAVELREDIVDKVDRADVDGEFDKINKSLVKISDIVNCDMIGFDTMQEIAELLAYTKNGVEGLMNSTIPFIDFRIAKLDNRLLGSREGAVLFFDYTNADMQLIHEDSFLNTVDKIHAIYEGMWEKNTGILSQLIPVNSDKIFSYIRLY